MKAVYLLLVVLVASMALAEDEGNPFEETEGSCGNGVCNPQEDCLTCEQDCGVCDNLTQNAVTFENKKPNSGETWSVDEELSIEIEVKGEDPDSIDLLIDDAEVPSDVEGNKIVYSGDDPGLESGEHEVKVVVAIGEETFETAWTISYEAGDLTIDVNTPQGTVGPVFWLNFTTSRPAECDYRVDCEGCGVIAGPMVTDSTRHSRLIDISDYRPANPLSITVQCADEQGIVGSEELEVDVEWPNTPPRWVVEPSDRITNYSPMINYSFKAVDDDNDTLTYSVSGDDEYVSLEDDQLAIDLPAGFAGDISVALSASDGKASISKDFTITILAPAPAINSSNVTNGTQTINVTNSTVNTNSTTINVKDSTQVNNTGDLGNITGTFNLETGNDRSSSSGGGSRRRSSGGGGSAAATIDWTCTEWGPCSDGSQARECTARDVTKQETRECQLSEPVAESLAVVEEPVAQPPVTAQENATEEYIGNGITANVAYTPFDPTGYRKPLRYLLAGCALAFIGLLTYAAKRRWLKSD